MGGAVSGTALFKLRGGASEGCVDSGPCGAKRPDRGATSNNTRYRCRWGTVMKPHGHQGMVRVKFAKNISGCARGATVRVMLYPNKTQ